jgi:hypothetical protein
MIRAGEKLFEESFSPHPLFKNFYQNGRADF